MSELCALKWKHLSIRNNKGQITVTGKGIKTRTVLIPASLWVELQRLRGNSGENEPVFRSQKHSHDGQGHLQREWVHKIVQAAAKPAGITGKVSPHALRHAHASHALERGAKIHLVSATLGHSSIAITSRYLHAQPDDSSGLYLP